MRTYTHFWSFVHRPSLLLLRLLVATRLCSAFTLFKLFMPLGSMELVVRPRLLRLLIPPMLLKVLRMIRLLKLLTLLRLAGILYDS